MNLLSLIFRDALALRVGYKNNISSDFDTAASLSKLLTKGQLMALVEEVERLKSYRNTYMNNTLLVTLMCSRLREAAGR